MYKKMLAVVFLFLLLINLSYVNFNNIYKKYDNYKDSNLKKYIEYDNSHDIETKKLINIVNYGLEQYDVKYINSMMDIINEKYFIRSRLDRYINYSKTGKYTSRQIVENVNCNLDYSYYTNTIKTDIKKGNLMLVNKYYSLGDKYDPKIITLDSSISAWGGLVSEAKDAFIKLHNDALKDNFNITNQSPYRSYERQYNIYNSYVLEDGIEATDKVSARPGYSEHQSGYALDVGDNFGDLNYFGNSKAFEWMINNAYKYGFILRYPKGKEAQTGYEYEPWHYRFVGTEVAKYIHDNEITFDEYYAYFVEGKGV